MTPDKIYLPYEYAETDVLPVGVTDKPVFEKDVCYIRKDALLEWAKQQQLDSLTKCWVKVKISTRLL